MVFVLDKYKRPVRHQELAGQASGTGHPLAVLPGGAAVRRILLREGGRGAFLPIPKGRGLRAAGLDEGFRGITEWEDGDRIGFWEPARSCGPSGGHGASKRFGWQGGAV